MGDLLQVQCDVRNDTLVARAAAQAPKIVAEFFGDHLAEKLLALCQAHDTHALPQLWIKLAAANGKCERETIETKLRVTGTALGDPELAPVVSRTWPRRLSEFA